MPPPSAVRRHRIRRALLAWYDAEHRALPWRGTRDPYAVLVSEVMLQQTQAERVADRFVRFMRRFPSPDVLAEAATASVLAEWVGLGYNRRALALHRTAAEVARAGWPSDVRGLERLPGVGPYTARAIASLAFGTPVGVVDTNVRRWLIRRFGVDDRPGDLQSLADMLARAGDDGRTDSWTHATMEFGARVCRARAPRCEACPIARGCPTRGRVTHVPVRRQPPLRGSDRAIRGAIVRALATAEAHALDEAELRDRVDGSAETARWRRLLEQLERDGLAHRANGVVRLGTTTIGA